MLVDTDNIYTITDLRRQTSKLLQSIRSQKRPAVILQQGKPMAALMDIKQLDRIQELLEDFEDYLVARNAVRGFKKRDYLELDAFWKRFELAR